MEELLQHTKMALDMKDSTRTAKDMGLANGLQQAYNQEKDLSDKLSMNKMFKSQTSLILKDTRRLMMKYSELQ